MSVVTATPLTVIPSAADPITLVTGSSPAWASGGWVTLVASSANPCAIAGVVIGNTNVSAQTQLEIDLGTGTVDHEVVIATLRLHLSNAGNGGPSVFMLSAPIGTVASNSRISARVRKNGTLARNVPVSLLVYESFDGDVIDLTTSTILATPAASDSLLLTPSATAWDASAFYELITATGANTSLLGLAISTVLQYVDLEFDLATGPAGSESVITTLRATAFAAGHLTQVMLPAAYPVGMGVRVSVRMRKSGTDTTPHQVALLYIGGGAADSSDTPNFTDGRPGTLAVITLTDRDNEAHPFSHVDLNDDPDYYDGYKAPKVLELRPIVRALSDAQGQITHASFGAVLSDTDRLIRGFFDDATKQYLTNAPLTVLTVSDRDRRLRLPMHYEMVGYVTEYGPKDAFQFEFTGSDWLKKKFTRNRQVAEFWVPLLTRDDFPQLPAAFINKAAPLWYGKVTDEIEGSGSVSADLYPRGTADPGWIAWGYNYQVGGSLNPVRYYMYGTTITNGVESQIIAFELGITMDAGHLSFYLYVRTAVTPDLYRFYLCDDGAFNPFTNPLAGTVCRYLDVVPGDLVDNPYGAPNDLKYVLIDSETIGNDYHALVNDGAGGTLLTPRGAVPTWYVGDETYGGVTRSAFLVCRGALQAITGVFINGVEQIATGSATEIECPFLGDYATTFGANYRDLNGTRYTIVYATGTIALNAVNGSAPITVNVYGIESVGDTSGDLITSPVRIREHFERNFLAADFIAGAAPQTIWLTTVPTLPNGAPIQDAGAYDRADAALADRLGGGYVCAGGICATLEPESALDVLASLHLNGDFDGGINRLGQSYVSVEPIAAPSAINVTILTDIYEIQDHAFAGRIEVAQNFWNVIPFVHTQDYVGRTNTGWAMGGTSRDATSIDNYDQEQVSPELPLRWLRYNTAQGIDTILDVILRRRTRYRHPLRFVEFAVPYLSGAILELGSVVRLDHVEGLGASGWVGHDVRVVAIETDLDTLTRRITAYDLQPIYGGLDDTVGPTQEMLGERPDTLISLQQNAKDVAIDLAAVEADIATIDTELTDHESRLTALETGVVSRGRVRVATTANITIATALNNGDTVDGVTLATDDRVLVKNQSAPEENGVYVVGASPARASDFDVFDDHPGALLIVEEGTANADTAWICTSNEGGTLNTTAIVFAAFPATAARSLVFGIVIDGGAAAITTGIKGFVRIPVTCTITKVTVLSIDAAVTAGSIVVDLWKDTYANYPPDVADTITASAKPTLSSATASEDSTLTGWTTSVTAGDVIGFNVDSATTVTKVLVELEASL